jgi:hypothetical protein
MQAFSFLSERASEAQTMQRASRHAEKRREEKRREEKRRGEQSR